MSIIALPQPTTSPADQGWFPSPLYRMTVEQYEAMVDSGVFTRRDRVHLINGYLVAKMTQKPPHTIADDLCGAELARIIPADLVYPPGQTDPAPRPGHRARARSLRRAGPDPQLRGPASRPGRHRPGRRGRRLQPGGRSQAGRRGLRARRASRSTGSSTWSIARSRSTPARARGLPVVEVFRRASPSRRDRRPAARPDRRRRHLAFAAGRAERRGQRGLSPGGSIDGAAACRPARIARTSPDRRRGSKRILRTVPGRPFTRSATRRLPARRRPRRAGTVPKAVTVRPGIRRPAGPVPRARRSGPAGRDQVDSPAFAARPGIPIRRGAFRGSAARPHGPAGPGRGTAGGGGPTGGGVRSVGSRPAPAGQGGVRGRCAGVGWKTTSRVGRLPLSHRPWAPKSGPVVAGARARLASRGLGDSPAPAPGPPGGTWVRRVHRRHRLHRRRAGPEIPRPRRTSRPGRRTARHRTCRSKASCISAMFRPPGPVGRGGHGVGSSHAQSDSSWLIRSRRLEFLNHGSIKAHLFQGDRRKWVSPRTWLRLRQAALTQYSVALVAVSCRCIREA